MCLIYFQKKMILNFFGDLNVDISKQHLAILCAVILFSNLNVITIYLLVCTRYFFVFFLFFIFSPE